jgi:hypothetical protein
MSMSYETTEWHLTPRGWVRGTQRLDFGSPNRVVPPKDRVLSVRWIEEQTHPSAKSHKRSEEIWRTADKQLVSSLVKTFGTAPERLA